MHGGPDSGEAADRAPSHLKNNVREEYVAAGYLCMGLQGVMNAKVASIIVATTFFLVDHRPSKS